MSDRHDRDHKGNCLPGCPGCEIERLLKLVHEQDAERRRDALDGQAALDEAGNEINRLTEHCGRQEREIEKRGAEIERLRDVVEDARAVIERGVDLMTNEQVGHWEGVRTWLELEAPEVSDEGLA